MMRDEFDSLQERISDIGEPGESPYLNEAAIRGQLLAFARDLSRIHRKERARTRELEHAVAEIEESYIATIQAMAFIVEARDVHTFHHLNRAHDYAVALAERVDTVLADDKVFKFGFLLHDIGKVGIPEHILTKPTPLTREEWEVMQTHPLLGGQILAPIRFLRRAIPIVECHHERWDGAGYPRGLDGEDIPLAARIFTVVDSFDAMTSDRPYRRALSVEEAVSEIVRVAGTQFDPELAHEFAALCAERMDAWPLDRAATVAGIG
ncbi:MAG: HD-GYP domain-containing protein [Actinomycetota bacterium]